MLRFFLVLILISGSLFAQSANDDAIRADNTLPPEAYKFTFNSAGSVDFHGDYSASIPLMTVPGRGGMDYPIGLSYKSGITATARATWVGLGWNLNPGSITRIINGIPDNVHSYMPGGHTYDGAIEDYYPNRFYGFLTTFPTRDYYDSYLVTIPGIVSGLIVPAGWNSSNTVEYCFQTWNGWIVSARTDTFTRRDAPLSGPLTTLYHDIREFILIDTKGTKYVFGLPLRSEMILYGGFNNSVPRFLVEYVSNWQLTSIMSADCGITLLGNRTGPTDYSGNYIKFEYNYLYNGTNKEVRDIRPLFSDRSGVNQAYDPYGLLTQTTYLSKVITPTHQAEFKAKQDRNDISSLCPFYTTSQGKSGIIGDFTTGTTGSFIRPLRLDSIYLYQRYPTRALASFVKLEYAASQSELCKFPNSMSITAGSETIQLLGIGKTTLKKVIIADSTQGYYYHFGYTDSIDTYNPTSLAYYGDYGMGTIGGFYRAHSGRMDYLYQISTELPPSGVIRNTDGAAAWSLRTITYPTGVIDTINYERDSLDLIADKGKSGLSVTWWTNFAPDECGLRVKSIASFDPGTQKIRRIQYQYAPGHIPGLPLSYLRNTNSNYGSGFTRKFLFGYNSAEVEYPWIRTVNDDSSQVQTFYTTSISDNANGETFSNLHYDTQADSGCGVFMEDNGWYRGKVISNLEINRINQVTNMTTSLYSNYVKFGGFWSLTCAECFPPQYTFMYYYVDGKRLSLSFAMEKQYDSTYTFEKTGSSQSSPRFSLSKLSIYSYTSNQLLSTLRVMTPQRSFHTTYTYGGFSLGNVYLMTSKRVFDEVPYKWIKYISGAGDTVWATSNYNYLRSSIKYTLKSNGFYVDSVLAWSKDIDDDKADAPNEYVLTKRFISYDLFGNPITIFDGGGGTISLAWDSTYNYSRITKRTVTSGASSFIKSYVYNILHLPRAETDENLNTTYYYYDGFGRLKKIIGPDGKTLKTYRYNFKNSVTVTMGEQ